MGKQTPTELYRKHRPKTLEDIVGQEKALKPLRIKILKDAMPHVICLAGPSGCGKTTTALVLKDMLRCEDVDWSEMNCSAEHRGIATVRKLRDESRIMPRRKGGCRIWFLDECQACTKDAQEAMLKLTENPPHYAYFFLGTSNKSKLEPALLSRCFDVPLRALNNEDITTILQRVLRLEYGEGGESKLSDVVYQRIAETAAGNARVAIQTMERVLAFKNETDQLVAASTDEEQKDAFEIVKAMLWQKGSWDTVRKLINNTTVAGNNWEGFRQVVLACATKEALKDGGNAGWACTILTEFESAWHYVGKAGLVRAAYAVLKNRR